MVVEDRIEKEKARRKNEQEAEELRGSIRVSSSSNKLFHTFWKSFLLFKTMFVSIDDKCPTL